MAERAWLIEDKDFRQVIKEILVLWGYSSASARDHVIIEWLLKGDPKPYIEALIRDETPGRAVQAVIAAMLTGAEGLPYYVKVERQPGLKGRPEIVGGAWCDLIVWQSYERERARGVKAEQALEAMQKLLGMSPSAIKGCVTRVRKLRAKYKRQATDPATTI